MLQAIGNVELIVACVHLCVWIYFCSRSSKNRRKAERKKHRLKEGSPHEESALLEALEQLWNAAHGLRGEMHSSPCIVQYDGISCIFYKDDVRTLLQNLYLFEYDVLARNLQSLLYDCLDHMVGHKEQIWTAQVTQSVRAFPCVLVCVVCVVSMSAS